MPLDKFPNEEAQTAYATAAIDQIVAAAKRRDFDGARAVLDRITADGHPQLANLIEGEILATGLLKFVVLMLLVERLADDGPAAPRGPWAP